MKQHKYFVLMMMIASMVWAASLVAAIKPYVQVTSERIPMRKGTGTSETVIAEIPVNTILEYLEKKDAWIRVKIPNNEDGYVYIADTKFVHYKTIEILSTAMILNGPHDSFRAIGQANRGAKLKVIGEEANYFLVVAKENQLGWIDFRDAKETSILDFVQIGSETKTKVAPYDDAPVFVTLKSGTQALKLDQKNGWYLVGDNKNGVQGWIKQDLSDEIDYGLRTLTSANLRDGASVNYNVIGMLEPGTPLIIIQKIDDWYDVQTKEGLRGWIAASDVVPYKAPQEETPSPERPSEDDLEPPAKGGVLASIARYRVTSQKSEIRQGYNTNFKVLDEVVEGSIVLVIGSYRDWYRIRYYPQGRIGWIQQNRLKDATIYFTNLECNIRQGYGTNFKVIRRVPAGTPLAKLDRVVDDWYRISMPDGVIGWILGELITPENDAYITNQFANVRDGAGTENLKIATLSAANVVSVIGSRGEWYRIKFAGNNEGWILNELVSPVYDYCETNEAVTLYNDATKSAKSNVTLPNGSGAFVINRENTMVQVRNATQKGWIDLESVDVAYINTLGNFIAEATIISTPTPTPSQPTTPSQPEPGFPDVTTLYTYQLTNIRMGPGTQYGRVIRVQPGVQLKVLSQQGDWYNVKLPDGNEGFVRGDVVSKQRVASTSVSRETLYTTQATRLYTEPDSRADRMAMTLNPGTLVTRIDVKGTWTQVTTPDNQTGWLQSTLLDSSAPKPRVFEYTDFIVDEGFLETTNEVNLRSGPSELANRIGRIPKGTRITKKGMKGNWYCIDSELGMGYISKDYANDVTMRPIITLTDVDVKGSRNTTSQTIGKWYAGRVLLPSNKVGSWYSVPSNAGEQGWVNEKDVTDLKFPEYYASGNVSVLREPAANATVEFTLRDGDVVKPVYDKTNWFFIKISDDKCGWVARSSVQKQYLPRIKISTKATAYKSPSMTSDAVGSLKLNEVYQPVAKSNEWYKIPYKSNQFGWVYSSAYTEILEDNVVVTQKASIREGPGKNYQLNGYISPGEIYQSVGKTSGWIQILKSDGDVGWIEANATKEYTYEVVPVTETIDVYNGPGEQFNIMKTLPMSTKLTPIDENEGWYKVKLDGDVYGWIKKPGDAPSKIRVRVVFTLDNSDIKREASESSSTVKRVEPATDLLIIDESGDWYKVKLPRENLEGWIQKRDVFE